MIPSFPEAVERLRALLSELGFSQEEMLWVARDDYYAIRFGWYYLAPDIPPDTPQCIAEYFAQGRRKGLVSIDAIFYLPGKIGCTIWFPDRPEEEVQGWNEGLKIGVNHPLGIATEVRSSLRWKFHRLRPQYHRFQLLSSRSVTRDRLHQGSS